MKLLTLNTHSLQEPGYLEKLDQFVAYILREQPDLVALQEVSQTADAEPIPPEELHGQHPVPGHIPVRRDNHAAAVAKRLQKAGIDCHWAWLPIKLGYSKYDEGVALFSLGRPIVAIDQFPVSCSKDYSNWRTRAVLGVQLQGMPDWFYCVHLGWWDEKEESFREQWKTLQACLASKVLCSPVWLLGDFNAPDQAKGESYDLVRRSGWVDTYCVARSADDGLTVPGVIDGWREKLPRDAVGMRLDYIWCSRDVEILSSQVVFNGKHTPIVSDHFGVMVETKE